MSNTKSEREKITRIQHFAGNLKIFKNEKQWEITAFLILIIFNVIMTSFLLLLFILLFVNFSFFICQTFESACHKIMIFLFVSFIIIFISILNATNQLANEKKSLIQFT